MPTLERFFVPIIRMLTAGGHALAYPLMTPGALWLTASAHDVAVKLGKYVETCLESGDLKPLLALLPAFERVECERMELDLSVHKATGDAYAPDFPLEAPVIRASVAGGTMLVHAPTIPAEVVVGSPEETVAATEEAVRAALARLKRLRSAAGFLPVLWWTTAAVTQEEIVVAVPTVTELAGKSSAGRESLLARVGARQTPGEGEKTWQRDEDVLRLARAVRGPDRRSVLVVGPSGTGKSAVIGELGRRKTELELGKLVIWSAGAAGIIRGLTAPEGWLEKLAQLCAELQSTEAVLHVRNFAQLFEIGRYIGNDVSVGEALRDPIARREIQVVSECTAEELTRLELRYPAAIANMHVLRLSELDEGALRDAVRRRAAALAESRGLMISDAALEEVLSLHWRYASHSGMPGKALRFLSSLLAAFSRAGTNVVQRADVIGAFCEQTGIPAALIDPQVPLNPGAVYTFFSERLLGQPAAVSIVCEVLAAVKARLVQMGKPIASLFFVGPTGVGKTELAKALAAFVFSSPDRMTRFDMSEYATPGAVLRLTGDDAGSEGRLTGAVREQPFCVLLFDELEKADSSFFDLLLQVLGEGRLTDARGKVADFSAAIIIMTSNLGTDTYVSGRVGFGDGDAGGGSVDLPSHFERAAQQAFRPELFNRIDRIVPFASLSPADVRAVLERELGRLAGREPVRRGAVAIEVAAAAKEIIAARGFDAKLGARQLQRAVSDSLLVPIAECMSQYGGAGRLVARAETRAEAGALAITVREGDPWPAGGRIRIDEHGRKRVPADGATSRRWYFDQVYYGSVYCQLLSQLDILEHRKEASGEAFWESSEQAARYSHLLAVRCEGEALLREIEELEDQAVAHLLGAGGHEVGEEQLAQIDSRHHLYRVRLYAAVFLAANCCTIGVYGSDACVGDAARTYISVARRRDYRVKARLVLAWDEAAADPVAAHPERPGRRKERPPTAPVDPVALASVPSGKKRPPTVEWKLEPAIAPFPKERVFGVELQIDGPCAADFFSPEGGVYEYGGRVDQRVFVCVSKGGLNSFKTPESYMRKTLVEPSPRRTIYATQIHDEQFDELGPGEYDALLAEILLWRLLYYLSEELL
ncbi:MAG: AAA family ATPase [Candidatus Schekmanbacteria bacterium]|nr:AAA family ATPase [Candidatus Schekmanbacteria bacterium]